MSEVLQSRSTRASVLAAREEPVFNGWATSAPRPASRPLALPALERAQARAHVFMFLASLVIRVAFLTLAGRYRFSTDFGFGWETGRIARALATGRGFSDPFHGQSGPTAWLAPVYPLLLAGIFKAFGLYSALSGWAVLSLNSVCSSLTAVVLSKTGAEVFGARTGRHCGWAWALLPYTIYWPTKIVWDTNLTALLLAVAFFLTIRLGRVPSVRRWAAYGLVWGLLSLTNPAPLVFAPVAGAFLVSRLRHRMKTEAPRAALAALIAFLLVFPWLLRNYKTFGEFVFIRGNFGEELAAGNNPESLGTWTSRLHPTQNPKELARYRVMGEVAYVRAQGDRALRFILDNKELFLANSLRRAYWFWCGSTEGEVFSVSLLRGFGYSVDLLLTLVGLGMLYRRGRPEASLFAGLFALFPLVYYATFATARYRHPIEPEMLLLVVYALTPPRSVRLGMRPVALGPRFGQKLPSLDAGQGLRAL